MNDRSIWQTVDFERQPPLGGDTTCQYAIVGAGLCGLMCAFELTERGVAGDSIAILEADMVCAGATARTTAKLTAQHALIYDRIIDRYGARAAQEYANLNTRAIDRVREIVAEHRIDCDLENCRSVVYATGKRSVQAILNEAKAAERLGFKYELCDHIELPIDVQLALAFEGQAKFHPLKFAHAIYKILLERGCRVYEQTTATSIHGGRVVTAEGEVRAAKIIVSSHYPFADIRGLHFAKLYQHRSFVLAAENAAVIRDNYYCIDGTPVSFRGVGSTLLIGGEGNKCGDGRDFAGLYDLIDKACEIFPECMVMSRWANQDVMSYSGLPTIGPINRFDGNIYVATAFNEWGMTTSVAAAGIIADLAVEGRREPMVVSPGRPINGRTVVGFARQMGEIAAEFATDFSSPRCSHMGCPLTYNQAEGTWDCPGHGARFSEEGDVLHGPAKHPIDKPNE